VPIAAAYMVAHYFSLLVIQGQFHHPAGIGPIRLVAGISSGTSGVGAEPRRS
jgi:hypothetical protein